MKKLTLAVLALFAFTFFACEVEPAGENIEGIAGKGKIKANNNSVEFDFSEECLKEEAILYAGQNIEVGKVTVSEEGTNYVITYEITNDEWCITETHLSVVNAPEDFPMTNSGNPKNGDFEYSDEFACEKTVTYEVPMEKGPYIAAHAVVECVSSSPETIMASLPETVNFCTTTFRPNGGDSGYFSVDIQDGVLTGEGLPAWCVDIDQTLGLECLEDVSVISTLGTLPEGLFEQPENIGAVNWLINSNVIGQESSEFGPFTGDDVQMAIWVLLDDPFNEVDTLDELPEADRLDNWDVNRSQELVDLALQNLEFVPECGDEVGIVLSTPGKQPVLISYPLECSPCNETAWADGCDFPGNNWATYFEYGTVEVIE